MILYLVLETNLVLSFVQSRKHLNEEQINRANKLIPQHTFALVCLENNVRACVCLLAYTLNGFLYVRLIHELHAARIYQTKFGIYSLYFRYVWLYIELMLNQLNLCFKRHINKCQCIFDPFAMLSETCLHSRFSAQWNRILDFLTVYIPHRVVISPMQI